MKNHMSAIAVTRALLDIGWPDSSTAGWGRSRRFFANSCSYRWGHLLAKEYDETIRNTVVGSPGSNTPKTAGDAERVHIELEPQIDHRDDLAPQVDDTR